jgi:trk system potassium uptake protein TrkA
MGHEVLGVDRDAQPVHALADDLTQTIEADTTDFDALRALGAADFSSAVVGIGTDIEASVLTVLGLADLKIPSIWAKATNENHGRILQRTGAHHIVFPEARMGERVAHLLNGRLMDFIQFDDRFAIAKLQAPPSIVGVTLQMSDVRKKYGITVVGHKACRPGFRLRGARHVGSPRRCSGDLRHHRGNRTVRSAYRAGNLISATGRSRQANFSPNLRNAAFVVGVDGLADAADIAAVRRTKSVS